MFEWYFTTETGKSKEWYIIALIVVLFLVVYGIIEGLYLMSIVAFLFAGVYILIENNSSPTTSVYIDENIIRVNTTTYEIVKIQKFGIISHDGKPYALRIFITKSLPPVVDIPFTSEVDGHAVQEFLAGKIEFDPSVEYSQGEKIMQMFRL